MNFHLHDSSTKRDLTGTNDIATKFWRDMSRRWKKVEALTQEAIATHDLLGLTKTVQSISQGSDKVLLFQRWLDQALQQIVILNGSWMKLYVEESAGRAEKRVITLDSFNPDEPRDKEGKWTEGSNDLANKLKSISGSGPSKIISPDQLKNDPDAKLIEKDGELFHRSNLAKFDSSKIGSDSLCHWNVARLYEKGKIDDIAIGYAQNDQGWHQHTWGIKGGKIVETTASNLENLRWFGVKLNKDQSDKFATHVLANKPGEGNVRTLKGNFIIKDAEDWLSVLSSVAVAELQGVCEAASQQAVRTVAQGLLSNYKPAKIAREVVLILRNVGEARAATFVDYMIIKTFAAATLESFRARGVTRVGTIAEHLPVAKIGDAARSTPQKRHSKSGKFVKFTPMVSKRKYVEIHKAEKRFAEAGEVDVQTAEDDRVCQRCQNISDNGPYYINEALNLIPAHPNCRCVFIPAGELDQGNE